MPDENTSTATVSATVGGEPTPTTTPSPAPSWTDADGNFSEKWLDRIPPEVVPLDAKPTLAKYRSVPELSKAHWHLQQALGKKATAVQIPKPDSPPEEVSAYRKAIGVPEKVEEYQFKPDTLPDGYEWDDKGPLQTTVRQIAHKHNLPPAALKELATAYTQFEALQMDEAMKMQKERLDGAEEVLKGEWKAAYEQKVGLATRAAKTVGLDLRSPGLTDPNVVKALARLGEMLSEDKLVTGDFSPTEKPGEARAMAIIKGSDPSVMHLHKQYTEGDEATVKMVRDMLRNG